MHEYYSTVLKTYCLTKHTFLYVYCPTIKAATCCQRIFEQSRVWPLIPGEGGTQKNWIPSLGGTTTKDSILRGRGGTLGLFATTVEGPWN